MLAPAVLFFGWTVRELSLFSSRCFLVYDQFFDAGPLKVPSQDRLLVQLECSLKKIIFKKKRCILVINPL